MYVYRIQLSDLNDCQACRGDDVILGHSHYAWLLHLLQQSGIMTVPEYDVIALTA